MWIFGLLAFYGLLNETYKQEQDDHYQAFKEDWRLNACPQGKHFIGASAYSLHPFCEICHEYPKVTKTKNGIAESWKFKKNYTGL